MASQNLLVLIINPFDRQYSLESSTRSNTNTYAFTDCVVRLMDKAIYDRAKTFWVSRRRITETSTVSKYS